MTPEEFKTIRLKVNQLTDGLGKPVDPGIFDSVAVLRALGINTTGSCEGHIDRITGGPYVMFEAPGLQKYIDAFDAIPDRLSPAYKKAYRRAVAKNMQEVKKVVLLLEDFYKDRLTPVNQRLIVQHFGTSASKLMCQGAYLAHTLTREKRKELLYKNRAEMRAFTDYLMNTRIKAPRVTQE